MALLSLVSAGPDEGFLREMGLTYASAISVMSSHDSPSKVSMDIIQDSVLTLQVVASNFGSDGLSLSRSRCQS